MTLVLLNKKKILAYHFRYIKRNPRLFLSDVTDPAPHRKVMGVPKQRAGQGKARWEVSVKMKFLL